MSLHRHRHSLSDPWQVGAVVLAGGYGERLGRGPKALIEIADKPLLLHVLESTVANDCVTAIVITAPDGMEAAFQEVIDSADLSTPIEITRGGLTRQDSAHAGVRALPPSVEWVAVTDVARPFTHRGTVDRLVGCLRGVAQGMQSKLTPCGAIPVIPLTDSVHLVTDHLVLAHPFDRSTLRAAQAPQFFSRTCITAAYESAMRTDSMFTDDAGMVSHFGGTVTSMRGDVTNIKITYEYDLTLAEAIYYQSLRLQ
ncbi:IspD/TarI family cytidylyltransferase [Salinispora arenicola]|uniref:IspD/TarI family cytidylyltransferase n=1 Tax=Salinispora arenicola TaxID=168697 RepID=UPI00039A817A|nr:2-C-methyl-D-erythritol 4-phosphate cytidylyltransferase [Salinispora arenicola]NIL64683.1 2-C-methyl-D-erythritol 4-phosphate cytidylyltransferase [Salinispora arenicola]